MDADRTVPRSRKPLSDLTNIHSHSRTSSQSSPSIHSVSKPHRSSSFSKSLHKCKSASTTSSSKILTNYHNASNPTSLPTSTVFSPSRPLKSSLLTGTIDRDVSEPISVVYSRRRTSDERNYDNTSNPSSLVPSVVSTPSRLPKVSSVGDTGDRDISDPISVVYGHGHVSDKRKSKEMAVAIPFSKKPAEKIFNYGEKSNDGEAVHLLKSSAEPCRKKNRVMPSKQNLSKPAPLQDYIDKQRAYFREIDEYQLPVEEVESDEELD